MPSSTARVRHYRQRQRDGKAVFTVSVELDGLRDLLVASHILGEWDTEDLAAVRCGLERLISALIADVRERNF